VVVVDVFFIVFGEVVKEGESVVDLFFRIDCLFVLARIH